MTHNHLVRGSSPRGPTNDKTSPFGGVLLFKDLGREACPERSNAESKGAPEGPLKKPSRLWEGFFVGTRRCEKPVLSVAKPKVRELVLN